MTPTTFAAVSGVAYVGLALFGLDPELPAAPWGRSAGNAHGTFGYVLALFPVNALHTVLHAVVGVWGLWAATRPVHARRFAAVTALVFGALAIAGFLPGAHGLLAVVPMDGHAVWLHGLTALGGSLALARAPAATIRRPHADAVVAPLPPGRYRRAA
jgi:hypothetical protein